MATNNAPLTNQGRADLRRSPTEAQIAFNNNRSSQISVLDAELCELNEARNALSTTAFSPTITVSGSTRNRRLSVFVWMTDRVTACWAEQLYPFEVLNPDDDIIGNNLCACAAAAPTNGFYTDVVGTSCDLLTADEVGKQALLTYGSGSTALAVRGTPLLIQLRDNGFLYNDGEGIVAAPTNVHLTAFAESLLSGKPQVTFTELRQGAFYAYGSVSAGPNRRQIILRLSDYVAGQYWLTNNVWSSGGESADIVGVWSNPPWFPAIVPPAGG